jgi:hypothetical protein
VWKWKAEGLQQELGSILNSSAYAVTAIAFLITATAKSLDPKLVLHNAAF